MRAPSFQRNKFEVAPFPRTWEAKHVLWLVWMLLGCEPVRTAGLSPSQASVTARETNRPVVPLASREGSSEAKPGFCATAGGSTQAARRGEMFRKALLGGFSTGPLYVLFTHISPDGKQTRDVAVSVNFLRGAIARECAQGCSELAMKRAEETQTYQFRSWDAWKRLEPRYSRAQLTGVRAELAALGEAGVRREALVSNRLGPSKGGVAPFWGPFHALYDRYLGSERLAITDAIAHVLLECGYLPGMRDKSGALYVSEGPRE